MLTVPGENGLTLRGTECRDRWVAPDRYTLDSYSSQSSKGSEFKQYRSFPGICALQSPDRSPNRWPTNESSLPEGPQLVPRSTKKPRIGRSSGTGGHGHALSTDSLSRRRHTWRVTGVRGAQATCAEPLGVYAGQQSPQSWLMTFKTHKQHTIQGTEGLTYSLNSYRIRQAMHTVVKFPGTLHTPVISNSEIQLIQLFRTRFFISFTVIFTNKTNIEVKRRDPDSHPHRTLSMACPLTVFLLYHVGSNFPPFTNDVTVFPKIIALQQFKS